MQPENSERIFEWVDPDENYAEEELRCTVIELDSIMDDIERARAVSQETLASEFSV